MLRTGGLRVSWWGHNPDLGVRLIATVTLLAIFPTSVGDMAAAGRMITNGAMIHR
jgi:hypothetical protein